MVVLWWLVPPLVVTMLAMCWAAWAGRTRDDVRRDDSDAALARMQKALAKPARGATSASVASPIEPTHGVALRSASARPASSARAQR